MEREAEAQEEGNVEAVLVLMCVHALLSVAGFLLLCLSQAHDRVDRDEKAVHCLQAQGLMSSECKLGSLWRGR